MTTDQYRLLGLWPYDARTNDWAILKHGVWPIMGICAFWLALVHVILPRYMRNRPAKEFRITMLVLNSLQLTSYVGGLPISIFFNLNSGSSFLTCKPTLQPASPLYIESLLHIGYLYIWWKLLDAHRSIIAVLRKKNDQIDLLKDLFRVNEIVLIYFGFRIQPIGMSMFYPTIDAVVSMYVYLYYVLSSGGSYYVHTRYIKKAIPYLRFVQAAATLIHALVIDPNHCDYPSLLLYFEFEVSIILLLRSCYEIVQQWNQSPALTKKD